MKNNSLFLALARAVYPVSVRLTETDWNRLSEFLSVMITFIRMYGPDIWDWLKNLLPPGGC